MGRGHVNRSLITIHADMSPMSVIVRAPVDCGNVPLGLRAMPPLVPRGSGPSRQCLAMTSLRLVRKRPSSSPINDGGADFEIQKSGRVVICRYPGIDHRHVGSEVIARVPRYERQAVLKSSRCDDKVRLREGVAGLSLLLDQQPLFKHNVLGHLQDALFKHGTHLVR
jgi:hypothetical protein